jgi:uncharacterized protein (TIGR02597 family)
MKPYTYALLAAAAMCGLAAAETAYTTPVGYVTETLAPSRDNLIGLTVHSPTVAAGTLDSATSNSVTDAAVNFGTLLTSGSTYILEINNGSGEGYIQEITAWTGSTLTTPQNISSVVVGGTTTYQVRKAPTISEIFGATNSVGLTASADGSTTSADVILIPDGLGGFVNVFYYNDGTDQLWLDTAFNDASTLPLVYTDGLIVARKAGSPINLTVTGEVKTTPTVFVVSPGDNYLGAVYPVGSQLGSSGMGPQMIPSTDGSTTAADLILMPDGSGGYTTFMYYNDGTDQLWIDGLFNDSTAAPITSGFIFTSKSVAAKNIKDTPPASYSTL